eukprot:5565050-Prymnesium_polylepis.1
MVDHFGAPVVVVLLNHWAPRGGRARVSSDAGRAGRGRSAGSWRWGVDALIVACLPEIDGWLRWTSDTFSRPTMNSHWFASFGVQTSGASSTTSWFS